MSNFKGRHLAFLTVLCCAWLVTRLAFIWSQAGGIEHGAVLSIATKDKTSVPTLLSRIDTRPVLSGPLSCCSPLVRLNQSHQNNAAVPYVRSIQRPVTEDNKALVARNSYFEPAMAMALYDEPISDETATDLTISKVPKNSRGRELHAETYAFSYWRWGGTENGLAAGGQYGGGQSGFITTFALQNQDDLGQPHRLAVLVRAAIAHDRLDEREFALGGRWRPIRKLPVTLTAERRFRHDRRDAFALYAAGGTDNTRLPFQFRMDSFAQAGVVSGKDAGAFFDALARADRNVVQLKGISFHAGAGAWAAGQRDAMRLDIGPSLRTDIVIKATRFRVNADWRFRIAGNASPTNGPALTLSTGF